MNFHFQQFVNMTMNLGLQKSLGTCKDFPALLLMPTFSLWAFGSREKKSHKNCEGSSNFGVSFTSTFINILITCSGMIVSYVSSFYLYRSTISSTTTSTTFENGFDLCGLVFSKRPDPVLYIRKDGPVGPILSYIRFLCCQAL